MSYLYIKAIHIVFVVTWFAALFYMPRLLIYFVEAQHNAATEIKQALQKQLLLMMKRLWYAISVPSAYITLFLGSWLFFLQYDIANWLVIKIIFVIMVYIYHFYIQHLYHQAEKGALTKTSLQLRIINEVPTILLVAIVMLVVIKESLSAFWGIAGMLGLIIILLTAIIIYKKIRRKNV